jgi:hypothetical protein
MTTIRQIINEREEKFNTYNGKWSINDEAIKRAYDYAINKYEITKELLDEGASLKAVIKQAYQEGFLHGFEHKFDQTNYEEKK